MGKRLILASQSPRRIGLLKQIGFEFDVIPSSVDESFDPALTPEANARQLALEKARNVGEQIANGIVIGADTIVLLEDELLAKPVDARDAVGMLQRLSGRTHIVITGFALLDRPSNQFVSDAEMTKVTFRSLSHEEIIRYVAGGSPFDKAGGYGIQDDYGAVFVSRIEGCFYNVVGFPLSKFHETLGTFCKRVQRN